jgi:MFS family permease
LGERHKSEDLRSTRRIVAALVFAVLGYLSEGTIVFGSMPSLLRIFSPPEAVGWIISAGSLIGGLAAGICGGLGDHYGRKPVLMGVMALAALGGCIAGMGRNVYWVIAGHAMQGPAIAIVPLSVGLLREHLPPRSVPLAVAIVTSTLASTAGVLYMLSGLIVESLGWRGVFSVSSIVLAIGMLFVKTQVPESGLQSSISSVDWISGILFCTGAAGVLLSITLVRGLGWSSGAVIASAAVGVAVLTLWVVWSLRSSAPLINVRLLGNLRVTTALGVQGLMGISIVLFNTVTLVILQAPIASGAGFGRSATVAGAMLVPMSAVAFISGPLSGYLAGRYGAGRVLASLLLVCAVGDLWILIAHGTIMSTIGATLVVGLGFGALFPTIANLIVENTPREQISEIAGMSEWIRGTAAALSIQLGALVLAGSTIAVDNHNYPTNRAVTKVFGIALSCCLAACLLSLWQTGCAYRRSRMRPG